MRRRRDRPAVLMAAGTALIVAGVLPGFLTASLATRIRRDFPFAAADLGVAVAVFYAVCALGSTPAGRLVDRVGAAAGVRIAAILTIAGSAGAAFLVDGTASLVGMLVVAAGGNALGGPAVSALFRRRIAEARHGTAFGLQQAGAPLGSLLAGVALPAIAIPLDWRPAFLLPALLAAAAAVVAGSGPAGAAAGGERRAAPADARGVRLLGLAAALASAAGVGMVAFLVVYAVSRGLSEAAAGTLLAGVSLAAVLARILLGAATDRRGEDPLRLIGPMLAGSAVGFALLVAGEPATVVAGALVVGAIGWAWPGALTLAVVRRSPAAPAWAVGVMMTGLFGGAVAGPLVVGLLAEGPGYAAGWAVCGLLAVAAAATVAATRRRGRS